MLSRIDLTRTAAVGAPRAPRTLLIDACGQVRDNALRIWSDQTIVTVRQSLDERIIYCFVAGPDRNMKETFAVRPSAGSDAGREALKAACNQTQGIPTMCLAVARFISCRIHTSKLSIAS